MILLHLQSRSQFLDVWIIFLFLLIPVWIMECYMSYVPFFSVYWPELSRFKDTRVSDCWSNKVILWGNVKSIEKKHKSWSSTEAFQLWTQHRRCFCVQGTNGWVETFLVFAAILSGDIPRSLSQFKIYTSAVLLSQQQNEERQHHLNFDLSIKVMRCLEMARFIVKAHVHRHSGAAVSQIKAEPVG